MGLWSDCKERKTEIESFLHVITLTLRGEALTEKTVQGPKGLLISSGTVRLLKVASWIEENPLSSLF